MINNILVAKNKELTSIDYRDFYIKFKNHPDYSSSILETNSPIRQMVTKLEILLFTNKGDVITEPDMGCDLELYIHDFFVDTLLIENTISTQISRYIPEMNGKYIIRTRVFEANTKENPSNQNIIYVYFVISDEIELLFSF